MEFPALFSEKKLEFPALFSNVNSTEELFKNNSNDVINVSREELIKRLRSKYRRNKKPNTMESQLAAYTKLPESDIKNAVLGISRKKMARNPYKVAKKIAEMLVEPNS